VSAITGDTTALQAMAAAIKRFAYIDSLLIGVIMSVQVTLDTASETTTNVMKRIQRYFVISTPAVAGWVKGALEEEGI